MRRRFAQLLVLFLLLLLTAAWPPQPPEGPFIRSQSVGQAQDWTPVAAAMSEREAWYAATPPAASASPAPRPRVQRGTVTAAAMDGDRFDRLARCESGGDPATNTGNGFYGAFQFVLSSWHAAGGTGYPHEHSYAEQKSLAMSWAARTNPYTQWPVCWPRSA